MKRISLAITGLLFPGFLIVQSCNEKDAGDKQVAKSATITSNTESIKRGEYLVAIMGCDDCHTPKKMGAQGPEPDMDSRFSGHPAQMPLGPIDAAALKNWLLFNQATTAFVGPWGVSYAANLTPDDTGLGKWSESQFFKAIREGKYKGLDSARPLLPPMPWPSFKHANDEDLKAIFAYLKSVKPINNLVPMNVAPDKIAMLNKVAMK